MSSTSDARIGLDNCNRLLGQLGCERRLCIRKCSGNGKKILVWDDNHELRGTFGTMGDINRELTAVQYVLEELAYH